MLVKKSPNVNKKFRVIFDNGTHVDFGARGYSDYTIHKDPERKRRYIIRHQRRENWNNPKTAGYWSRWFLWERPSITESKKYIERKLHRKIKWMI